MRKLNLLFIMILYGIVGNVCVCAKVNAGWSRIWGGEYNDCGYSVQQTTDGGYIVAGAYGLPGDFQELIDDLWLIKTDSAGDILWTKIFFDTCAGCFYSIQQTQDEGYIMTGVVLFSGLPGLPFSDLLLIKTDSLGDTLWTRTYGSDSTGWDVGYSVQQTTDGGYIITGFTDSSGGCGYGDSSGCDCWLIKTDASGDTLWTRTYGGTEYDCGNSVRQTTDGGFIIAGTTQSFGAGYKDVYLIRTDSLGDTLWTRTFGDTLADCGNSVQHTPDGGYIIAGTTKSYGAGGEDIWLIKTDSLGDTLWTKTHGGAGGDVGNSIQHTQDGGYIITGRWGSYDPDNNVCLIKTDSLGDTLWTGNFVETNPPYSGGQGYSVQQTQDGGYIIAGKIDRWGTMYELWLIKTDSLGYIGIEEKSKCKTQNAKLNISPNPFTCETSIQFTVDSRQDKSLTTLRIYDVVGREVKTLVNEKKEGGSYSVKLGAEEMVTGIYFVKLNSGKFSETKKLILTRG